MGRVPYSGRLADPEFRRSRAARAATARTTLEYHVKAVVDRASDLTTEQRERLSSALLRAGGVA